MSLPNIVWPPSRLHTSLRKITEALAGELACPTVTAPDWSDSEWTLARAVAAMHGVSPLLACSLRWQGPLSWTTFLHEQRSHTEQRHERICMLLRRIDERLREEKIESLALKGVALHTIGLYQPGERPMADVDLLVRPRDARGTARILESLGFNESLVSWKERTFTPIEARSAHHPGEHAGNDLKIELHERVCERLPLCITDVSESIFPPTPHPGLNAYPSNSALMIHLLLHAAGAMAFQALRLLHLHDLALLSARMTAGDWNELLRPRAPKRALWWALPPLELMSRYYAVSLPDQVFDTLRIACPRILRHASRSKVLSDVSLSHLWVDAFPGIEWAQSAGEMLRYAASRIRPDAQQVALRENAVRTQAWASSARWSSLSQMSRIARWVTSRQARPATLYAVRATRMQAQ